MSKKIHVNRAIPGFHYDPKSGAFLLVNTKTLEARRNLKDMKLRLEALEVKVENLEQNMIKKPREQKS